MDQTRSILLFVPNIIGYLRIFLTVLAFSLYHNSFWFLLIYGVSVLLDGVDGYCARKLNQCSDFGAWLDVAIDLLGRGLLWCSLHQYGYIVIFVEWMTFVSTHCQGSQWKVTPEDFPWIVTKVMANGFKTPLGITAIGGLDVLPMWLYAMRTDYLDNILALPPWLQWAGLAVLTAGRGLCFFVECFYIYRHMSLLLQYDSTRAVSRDVK